jgi:putative oxidoreductase
MHPSESTQNILSFLGRTLIALLFIPAGLSKIGGFAGTVGYIASHGVPMPLLAAAVAIGAELGLGLLLLVGYQARWAAMGLAIFTFVITFVFHNFWAVPADQMVQQQQAFFKNMAVVGGLFVIVALGAGRWSIDSRQHREGGQLAGSH